MTECPICGYDIHSCTDCVAVDIEAAIRLLLLKDGDRDHMNHSDITCEQSMVIVDVLRRAKATMPPSP